MRNVTTSKAGRWQHRNDPPPAEFAMDEEHQEIETLVDRAQAGDEIAREALLGVIEEMLAEGIGLPMPKRT